MLHVAKGQKTEQTHKMCYSPVAVKYSYSDKLGSTIPGPHPGPCSNHERGPGLRVKMKAENLELWGDEENLEFMG